MTTNTNWSRPFFKKKNKEVTDWREPHAKDMKHDRMAEKFLQKKEKECPTSSKK
jgi:hypothetical protein